MARQLSGATDELLAATLDRHRLATTASPVQVTLPTPGVVEAFLRVDPPYPTPLSVVVPQQTVADVPQCLHPHLAAVHEREGCGVRAAPASTTVVSVPGETTLVDTDRPESLAVTGRGGGHDRYVDRWESAAEVTFDTPPRERLLAETAGRLGDRPKRVVARELDRTRARDRRGVDVVCLALWAGASANAAVRSVAELVEDLGIMSRGTVERRLERLRDEAGLIETFPFSDGSRGRPSRELRLDVDVDDPARPPDWVRAALVA